MLKGMRSARRGLVQKYQGAPDGQMRAFPVPDLRPDQIARLSAVAVKVADLVLIPVQPSPFDVWACADLVEMVDVRRAVTGGKPLAYFVVSRAIKNTKLSGEVSAALEDYVLPVFKSGTTQRVVYPTTASEGTTVLATFPTKSRRSKTNSRGCLMLKSKRSTRSSEGRQEALDVLRDEKVRLNLDIPKQTMRQLRMRAVEGETTVSDIIRKLVSEYLSK